MIDKTSGLELVWYTGSDALQYPTCSNWHLHTSFTTTFSTAQCWFKTGYNPGHCSLLGSTALVLHSAFHSALQLPRTPASDLLECVPTRLRGRVPICPPRTRFYRGVCTDPPRGGYVFIASITSRGVRIDQD